MKILVTGAQGFIARRLVAQLAVSHDVFALCRRPAQFDQPNVVMVRGDLAVQDSLRALPPRIDHVIHLAQSTRFREWPVPEAAQDIFCVNVLATQALLEYAQRAGACQFLVASTGSVYSPSPMPQTEDSFTSPAGYYAATKLAAEALARAYDPLFASCALRLFFPYGPGQTERLMSDLIGRVSSGRPISLRGDHHGLRFNPTYVDDIVSIMTDAIETRWRGVVNVASPETLSLREAGEIIGAALGRDAVFELLDGPPPVPVLPALHELHTRMPGLRCRTFAEGVRATLVAHKT